ncbi:unnamed protein product [Urochloa humidicola]
MECSLRSPPYATTGCVTFHSSGATPSDVRPSRQSAHRHSGSAPGLIRITPDQGVLSFFSPDHLRGRPVAPDVSADLNRPRFYINTPSRSCSSLGDLWDIGTIGSITDQGDSRPGPTSDKVVGRPGGGSQDSTDHGE